MNSLCLTILSLAAPVEAGNEASPPSRLPVLEAVDTALFVLGWAIVVGAGMYWFTRQRQKPLADVPERPNRLRPEFALLLVAGFLLAAWGLQRAVERLPNPEGWRIAASNLAQAIGGAGALVIGACSFIGGLRVFVGGYRRMGRDVLLGIAILPAALSVCGMVYFLTIEFETWRNPKFVPTVHTVIQALQEGGVPFWVLWAGAVVIAPVSEECFFRGLLQTMLRNAEVPAWVAAAVVGVLFGVSHSPQPDAIPTLVVFGFILGAVYERTGSLIPSIALHALFNAKTMLWETITVFSP